MAGMRAALKITLTVALLQLCASNAYPFDYILKGEISERFYVVENAVNLESGRFDIDDTYNTLYVSPSMAFSFGSSVDGLLAADIECLHSIESEKDGVDVLLRSAYLTWRTGRSTVRAGQQPFLIGKGLILDNDEPGISIDYRIKGPYYSGIDAVIVEDSSPLASITLGYKPGFLERLELFGVWFSDEDDSIAEAIERIIGSKRSHSTGDLFWYGVRADLFLWDVYFSGIFMMQDGRINLKKGDRERHEGLSSYLMDVGLDYNFSDCFSAGAFLFLTSGDKHPRRGEFHSFISVIPYNPRTSIFFNGGINEQFSSDAVSLSGITPAGVIAPGIRVICQPSDRLSAEMTVALMLAEKRPSSKQKWYGWEADLIFAYAASKDVVLFLEADYFHHGDFFKTRYGRRPDPVTYLILGLNLFF
ncbi:MAG: hypothetical protein BA864_08410 [Desulfuromonadales bacterium C00003093]|nr:MAG: hypothetical protein BA864_08410 [Desulfuromonadales bacterium C00003093]